MEARYEKVRYGDVARSCAVLIAAGVDTTGNRQVLGTSVKLIEDEVHWRSFQRELKEQGFYGVKLFISDAYEGLKAVIFICNKMLGNMFPV